MKLWRNIAIMVLLLLSGGLAYWYYDYSQTSDTEIRDLIPEKPLFVLQLKPRPADLRALRENSTFQILLAAQSDKKISDRIDGLRELISTNDMLFKLLHDHPLHVSAHVSAANSIDLLYCMEIGENEKLAA